MSESINFKQLVIEFSKFCKSERENYKYFGGEKISFRKRHPLYQSIIRNEFTENLKKFLKEKSL